MRDAVDEHVETWARQLPGLDVLKEEIFYRMTTIVRRLDANRADGLRAGGLPLWKFKTLLMLRREGAPYAKSPSELADILGLTRGALSGRLTQLEDDQLIEREHGTGDRRRVTVRLTTAGRALVEDLIAHDDSLEAALFSALTRREQQTLAALLRKLYAGLDRS